MSDVSLNSLAAEIHNTATDKGFWDKERNMGEMLMLMVSELAEALEEDREGRPMVWYRHFDGEPIAPDTTMKCTCSPKPEGLVVELADAVIRALDTLFNRITALKIDLDTRVQNERVRLEINVRESILPGAYQPGQNIGEYLNEMTKYISMATHMWPNLITVIAMAESMADELGYNLYDVVREKMDYNSGRPHMHGKAY